jgi:CubicO group peptidase (beta-lactamase class C family)
MRVIVLGCVVVAVAAAVASASGAAQPDVSGRLHRFLADASRRLDFNGTVLIARDGRILLEKGYGFANVPRRVRPAARRDTGSRR